MIEKKIRYDINIEKPSKTKPVKQGGVLNFLGKQKTVNAPVKWRSSKDHPIAHLSYITKDEEKILIDLNLYGSLKGKPNRGPFGLPSLQGSGGGSGGDGGSSGGDSGGDSGGPGDSGPGGSDDGSGHGGPGDSGPGDSGPGGSDEGSGHGGPGPGDTGSVGPSDTGFGIGPDAAQDAAQSAAQSISADDVSAQAQADQEDAATAAAAQAAQSQTGIVSTLSNLARQAFNVYSTFSPVGIAMNAISNISRGVTAPDDYSQLDTSVQTSAPSAPDGGGGITTINQFAPLYNTTTGDNTADAMRARLNALLVQRPTSYGIPAANQLSNYNLLDLVNLRR